MKGFFLVFFLFPIITYSQSNLPYKVGEHSIYDIYFGPIKVGSGDMKIEAEVNIDKTSTFHIVGKGKTSPFFDFFFKVRDVYQTYLDTLNVRPVRFIRDIKEGDFQKKQLYVFKHSDSLVFWKDNSHVISSNTQDMLSALFYARTFNKAILSKKKSFLA